MLAGVFEGDLEVDPFFGGEFVERIDIGDTAEFLRSRFFVFLRSLTLVRQPGELGCWIIIIKGVS